MSDLSPPQRLSLCDCLATPLLLATLRTVQRERDEYREMLNVALELLHTSGKTVATLRASALELRHAAGTTPALLPSAVALSRTAPLRETL